MKKRTALILAAGVFAFVLFFFLAPVVRMDIIPCQYFGSGYASLSYFLFNTGEAYLSHQGHFFWLTQSYANCI